jgi:rhodanese-related sulfurtransferase
MFQKLIKPGLLALEIDVPALLERRAGPGVQIVDCREPDEFAAGHMEGSILIPLRSLAFRIGELDPSKPVVIVCRSGQRSLTAARMVQASGFRDVTSLAGGLIAWVEAGQPLVR